MIDWTLNIAGLVSIGVSALMGVGFIWAIKTSVKVLDTRLTFQDSTILGINTEIRKLNETVTTLALQQKRMDVLEDRQLAQGKRFDEHVSRFDRMIDERRK